MGVLYIMWLRQLKRYWRSKSRMIGVLGQPILFLVAFGFGFGPIFEKAGGGDYIQFLGPGIITMTILFNAMFNGMEVIWDRQFGFLKETLVAPVSRSKIMIGRTLGGASVAFFQGLILFFITLIVGFKPHTMVFIPLAFMFMLLIAILFTALGIAIASKLEDMQSFPLIINFLIMPLFFLSGALFPLEGVPRILETIIKFNPLSYGVDGVRFSLTGVSDFGLGLNFSVLFISTLIVGCIGTYLFSRVEI